MALEIGANATIEFKVEAKDLAQNLGISSDDKFPPVFATARLVALMEASAAKVLIPLYEQGQLSVGVAVNITHMAPTLEGDTVKSVATFEGMEGKMYKFKVEAFDSFGKVGEATHTRAIVTEDRLMGGAKSRAGK